MSGKKKVFVIDDDPAVTEWLQAKLSALYEVLATNDPTQAVALVKARRPDLVICDVDMPGMDGGEVCRALAEDGMTHDIPFLYLTSIVSVQEVRELDGEVGGRPGMSKRAPIKDIAARIAAMIGV